MSCVSMTCVFWSLEVNAGVSLGKCVELMGQSVQLPYTHQLTETKTQIERCMINDTCR